MAEADPREYRGGVREPDESGQGDEGLVPREMVDEPTADTSAENNELVDSVQGQVTDKDPQDSAIDTAGGDEADATKGQTGRTADSPDELTDDNTKSKWDVANAGLANTGEGAS
ncbi:MAG TPA: hypothetical protein VGV90_00970 [Solirubrobacteraceae bacterium]|nr:hypothetical protein [Solirubrobacteraceae bacterium]